MSSNIEEVLRKTVPGFLPDRDCAPVGSMHGIWNHAGILAVTNLNHICHTITYLFGYIGDSSSSQIDILHFYSLLTIWWVTG